MDQPPPSNNTQHMLSFTPQPNLKKTPSGGRMMARMMSMQVAVPSDISLLLLVKSIDGRRRRRKIWTEGGHKAGWGAW